MYDQSSIIEAQKNEPSTCMKTWHDLESIDDNVEKLIFPMELDDDYDRGKINEYHSQVNFFQGSLSLINSLFYSN